MWCARSRLSLWLALSLYINCTMSIAVVWTEPECKLTANCEPVALRCVVFNSIILQFHCHYWHKLYHKKMMNSSSAHLQMCIVVLSVQRTLVAMSLHLYTNISVKIFNWKNMQDKSTSRLLPTSKMERVGRSTRAHNSFQMDFSYHFIFL